MIDEKWDKYEMKCGFCNKNLKLEDMVRVTHWKNTVASCPHCKAILGIYRW